MKENINFINNDISFLLRNKKKIREWINNAVHEEDKYTGTLSYIFCSDEYLLSINEMYLKSDYLTDIISFDYTEDKIISGDMLISIDRVKENAKIYKTTFQKELMRVMIHGILHLCGYKDKTEKEKKCMKEKEDYYLNKCC
ncbi:MAG: rRNA maturation RNase YbeY [Bacteroidales bacterium]|jgi:rRNA maturation RNase YbeY|nr:rRNA maturation RNase YbeY [Bacteroidales bacterium]MDD2687709.1 rRNA maturation RNase YbeY [Bacteroidales bacterium]MDD3330038.1 rRNA maturation RNase YbeY [Bacteroidales bacterium]MDD3690844.1 rRNA maturation RNase YbeY [Bacteroidales bacterium]MDD4044132.1 rRNA maturation RNase YbeY [Bacteroidales bacterium]